MGLYCEVQNRSTSACARRAPNGQLPWHCYRRCPFEGATWILSAAALPSTLHRHLDLSISLSIHKTMNQEADKQQRKHGCVQVGLAEGEGRWIRFANVIFVCASAKGCKASARGSQLERMHQLMQCTRMYDGSRYSDLVSNKASSSVCEK